MGSGHTPEAEYEDRVYRWKNYAFDRRFPNFIATRLALKSFEDDQEGYAEIPPPYMGDDGSVIDGSPLGPLPLVQELSRGPSGSVNVAFVGGRFVAVKYMNDCKQRLLALHPSQMLEEYRFLKVLNNTGLVPPVYFLSKEATLGARPRPKAAYTGLVSLANHERCVLLGTKVRYMVQAMAGPTVQAFFDWFVRHPDGIKHTRYTKSVLTVGLKVLDLIETIHGMGIVHGDIHGLNIAFKQPIRSFVDINIDAAELVLLDFGDSLFYPNNLNKPAKSFVKVPVGRIALLSMYQLEGYRTGPRDDIFNLVTMLANLCSRGRHALGEGRLVISNLEARGSPPVGSSAYQKTESEVLLYVKSDLPMFEYSLALASVASIGENISSARQDFIRNELEELASHVRSYISPDETPEYEYIRDKLDSIRSRLPSD